MANVLIQNATSRLLSSLKQACIFLSPLAADRRARRYLALATGSSGGMSDNSGTGRLGDLDDPLQHVVEMVERLGLVSDILKFLLAWHADLLVDAKQGVG